MRAPSPVDVVRLTQAQCLELLGSHRVGRLACTDRAMPMISPMSYALLGSQVLLRVDTTQGWRLDGQVVAFAIDDLDMETGSGWTVVMTGVARMVRLPGELLVDGSSSTGQEVCLLQGPVEGLCGRVGI